MPVIKIEDISHVRFAAPDLSEMRSFLTDFGLACFDGQDGRLYGKGLGGAPFLHSSEECDPGFRGIGFRAESLADLDVLAASENVIAEDFDAPGGGKVVRLTDPDGYQVEVVAGQAMQAAGAVPRDLPRNSATVHARERSRVRLEPAAAHVVRLGHCVLGVSNFRASEAWYKARFGFITSDEVEMAPGIPLGAFMRCDRGATPTDHHTLFLAQFPGGSAFMHAAFEVANFDDLMLGHAHLKAASRTPAWGVGRHILGSQIFDYWKDPWGHELEHWTDGDLFTAADGSSIRPARDIVAVQWGAHHPMVSG
jgi:catechol 2,3-dioxygenase-like lactoylglutathione lyase family enzyme